MNSHRFVKISKFLSYHLRHHPEELGLQLEVGGWVRVDELLKAAQQQNFIILPQELQEVVANNDKKRFSFDETATKIRANQGHSVNIDLQLNPEIPPDILYHGTHEQVVEKILQQGLLKMSRHHVHLSADFQVAKTVGQRRGRAVILQVDAATMVKDSYQFYCSENGVWLVEQVPPKYLKKVSS